MARFFKLTPDISVQYWLEFIDEEKVKLVKNANWPEKHSGTKGERFYLNPEFLCRTPIQLQLSLDRSFFDKPFTYTGSGDGNTFSGTGFEDEYPALVAEDFCRLQFHRENGARIVHFRPSDENPFLDGFGRPNPRTGRNCHNDFSETFVDRKPGTTFTKYFNSVPVGEEVWHGFEPVYLKVKPADSRDEYYLKVWTEWCDSEIFVMSETNPADTPQELRDYEFPAKNKSRSLDEFEEAAIKKYAPSQKFTHSPRFKK